MIKLSQAMGVALNLEKSRLKWATTQQFTLLLRNENY